MAEFPVVKGYTLRATLINSCGRPESGEANRLVTEGFVSVNLQPVMKDAQDLEQENAAGKVCVTDRTPPERKWWTVEAQLCNVNTALITMFTGWEQVVDWRDLPIGLRDRREVNSDYGVALELWTGGSSDDDCPIPTDDDIFSIVGSGKQYGYFLFGGKEFTMSGVQIGAQVSTFTLSGITLAMPQWGRGPYNVAGTDAAGTPGRMLAPTGKHEHLTLFRTPVAPPKPTGGARPLAIAGKFVAPDYYFGGPAGEPAADVAPSQDEVDYTVVLGGTAATGGDFTLVYTDQEGATAPTAGIAPTATNGDLTTILGNLPNLDVADVTVTGTAGNWAVKIASGGTLALGVNSLTPAGATVTVTKV